MCNREQLRMLRPVCVYGVEQRFRCCHFCAGPAYTSVYLMDNPFMTRAIQLSLENVLSGRGGPFGAVIVKNGAIVAEGVNQVTP